MLKFPAGTYTITIPSAGRVQVEPRPGVGVGMRVAVAVGCGVSEGWGVDEGSNVAVAVGCAVRLGVVVGVGFARNGNPQAAFVAAKKRRTIRPDKNFLDFVIITSSFDIGLCTTISLLECNCGWAQQVLSSSC